VGYIIHALAVGSDGSIFVALGLSDFGYHGLEVKQLLPSGELNESFGNAGSVEIDQIASDYNGWLLFDLLVRENGAVVGAGGTFATSQGPIIVQLLGAGMGDGPGVLSTQGLSVDEQDVSVDVRRTGGNAGHVSVAYQVLAYDGENSATIGEDFVADAARLEWKDGDATTQQIRVRIIDDDLAEDDELLTVLLTDARGGAGLGQAGAVIKVRANDGFSAGPGQLAFRGALDLLQVEEDDLDEDVTFNVPVERMSGSAGAVSVSYATTDGTATAGTDYLAASDTLSWADGESGVKSISIQTLHDSAAEGDEDFQIRLSNATGGATIHMLGGFQNVRILDNDTAIGFNPQTVSVSEQDTSVEVTIERIDPQGGEASVDYSTSGDSAAADSDFTSTSGTLTWAAGDPNEKTVEIPISDDSQDEPDETFTVSLANPSGGLSLGANSVATVTIVDNDAPSGSGGGGGGALDWLEILGLAALAWLGRGSHIGCRSGANAALGPVNDRPVRVADSTGRCNMFGKFLCR
jgi:hypothetical protein